MALPHLKFKELFGRFPARILHVGANRGQEVAAYARCGIEGVHVEALTSAFVDLEKVCADHQGQTAIHACCGEFDGQEVSFNIASNGGRSSSILALGRHAIAHPKVSYCGVEKMVTSRLDEVLRANNEKPFNYLVLDVQGYELFVLKGAERVLWSPQLKAAYIEVSLDPLYQGGCTFHEVCSFLHRFDLFVREVAFNEQGWGNAVFARKWWSS